MKRVGYIIPEFPGQTHIWMWREICWMRRWGVDLHIFSTRRPPQRDAARHDFAEPAAKETFYLWPPRVGEAVGSLLWAMLRHPLGLLKAVWLALTLPVNGPLPARWAKLLPLVLPACILARQVTKRNLPHLHSHTCSNSAILCMLVKRIQGTPFSLTLNANIDWWGGAMSEKFHDAEFTIAITQWMLDDMKSRWPELDDRKALLGRIGVDTEAWDCGPITPQRNGAAGRIVTVGRLHACKGHDVLLEAVRKLRDRGRDVTLRLLGDGPHRDRFEAQVRSANLEDRVTFLGSVSETRVKEELRQSDVFALASHAEPLGVVYMEAMALGVPTIGTAAGGVTEIITDGQDGLLVPPGDADALADALERVLDDPALREQLARKGRMSIVERFDARIGAATLYERMFGEAPPEPATVGQP